MFTDEEGYPERSDPSIMDVMRATETRLQDFIWMHAEKGQPMAFFMSDTTRRSLGVESDFRGVPVVVVREFPYGRAVGVVYI